MKIKVRQLTRQNVGQVVSIDNGATFGELSAVRFDFPSKGDVEVTIGGSVVVDMHEDEPIDVVRNAISAHQVRTERELEENGGALTGGDLHEIESILRGLLEELPRPRALASVAS